MQIYVYLEQICVFVCKMYVYLEQINIFICKMYVQGGRSTDTQIEANFLT